MASRGGRGGGVAAAQLPTSFGQELRACLRCRLVKTYDQVLSLSLSLCLYVALYLPSLSLLQFRESGCENCPFFQMEDDNERVVDCTTPNFNGFVSL